MQEEQEYSLNLPKRQLVAIPASLIKRLVALLIDLAVIYVIIFLPFGMFLMQIINVSGLEQLSISERIGTIESTLRGSTSHIYLLIIAQIAMMILVVLYFALLEYLTRQTVGKAIMNVYVRSQGSRLSFWQCILRNLELIVLTPWFWIIDPIFLFFRQQRLFEILSKTEVIESVSTEQLG